LRAKLRKRLPGHSEVVYVYESQSSLVISYSPTENGYDAVCTLALYPSLVKLFFTGGPQLSKADPKKLLKGSGKMVRYVELSSAADFDRAEIEALMAGRVEALERREANAKGSLIIKAEAQKQRRAKKAAPKSSPRKKAKAKR
jgi:hypothetical protein